MTTFKFEKTKLEQYDKLVQIEQLCIFDEVVLLSFYISLNISSSAEELTLAWANKLADHFFKVILEPKGVPPYSKMVDIFEKS